MTRHVGLLLATALWLGTASFSAHAHHAYQLFFDMCTSVTIEGRVGNVQWADPHVWIDLETDDGTTYAAEWTGPQNLTRAGVAADVLKAGDRVVVIGSPPLKPEMRRNQTQESSRPSPRFAAPATVGAGRARRPLRGRPLRRALANSDADLGCPACEGGSLAWKTRSDSRPACS